MTSGVRAFLNGHLAVMGPWISWAVRLGFVAVIINSAYPLAVAGRAVDTGVVLVAGAAIAATVDYLLLHPHYAPYAGFQPHYSSLDEGGESQ